ncbi:hypothetical protein AK812_SmicGene1167 [Symbiodinium microadriaticum]|uniref:Uncharacterized protein n=1 Tax=Symbiodinium microadriaticum TaxID=2951 RepID=A0A1Q9F4M6_SYMMI|nr:hypothetical protein AK812_SmicGene1167 [Symbiodinium microadriaticum]
MAVAVAVAVADLLIAHTFRSTGQQGVHISAANEDGCGYSVKQSGTTDIGFTLYNAGAQSGVVVVAGVAAVAVAVAVGVSARVLGALALARSAALPTKNTRPELRALCSGSMVQTPDAELATARFKAAGDNTSLAVATTAALRTARRQRVMHLQMAHKTMRCLASSRIYDSTTA